jgi:hypothetical protein
MRMSNDRDQSLIRSAVSDAAANLLSFIPSLGTREVFAFGSAVAVPTRLTFSELPVALRPNSEAAGNTRSSQAGVDKGLIETVIERWRGSTMSHRGGYDDDIGSNDPVFPVREEAVPLQPSPATLDPNRFRTLRKPLDAGPAANPDAPLPPGGYAPLPSRYR